MNEGFVGQLSCGSRPFSRVGFVFGVWILDSRIDLLTLVLPGMGLQRGVTLSSHHGRSSIGPAPRLRSSRPCIEPFLEPGDAQRLEREAYIYIYICIMCMNDIIYDILCIYV